MTAFGLLLVAAAAFAASGLLVALVRRWAHALALFDLPGERRLHTFPTPRGGGLAIVVVVLGGVAGCWPLLSADDRLVAMVLAGASAVVAAVSWLEDRGRLGPRSVGIRLLTQFAASMAVVAVGAFVALPVAGPVGAGWTLAAGAVATVWLTGLTNAFNFMDGIDGMAGGQAVCAGVAWAVLGTVLGSPLAQVTGALVAGASLGFLLYNWSPASIFLGDVGSTFLGFTVAALAVTAAAGTGRPLVFWAGALFVWPFVFDTAFTLCRRALLRENVFAPHTTHLYQALTRSGLSHATVSWLYVGLAVSGGLAGIGLAAPEMAPSWWAPLVPTLALALWAGVRARLYWATSPWSAGASREKVAPVELSSVHQGPTRGAVLAGAALGGLGLWFAFRSADTSGILSALEAVRLDLVLAALAATAGSVALTTWRWRVLLEGLGRAPVWSALGRAVVIGQMVNILSPVRLGEVARVYALGERAPGAAGQVLATIAVERALDLAVSLGALVALLAIGVFPAGPWLAFVAAFVTIALVLISLVIAAHFVRGDAGSPSWGPVRRVGSEFDVGFALLRRPGRLVRAALLTTATVALSATTNLLLLRALDLSVPFTAALVVLFSLQIASVLPSLPARIGVFHSATALALAPFGVGPNPALAYALVLYAVALLPKLVVGLAWLGPRRQTASITA